MTAKILIELPSDDPDYTPGGPYKWVDAADELDETFALKGEGGGTVPAPPLSANITTAVYAREVTNNNGEVQELVIFLQDAAINIIDVNVVATVVADGVVTVARWTVHAAVEVGPPVGGGGGDVRQFDMNVTPVLPTPTELWESFGFSTWGVGGDPATFKIICSSNGDTVYRWGAVFRVDMIASGA